MKKQDSLFRSGSLAILQRGLEFLFGFGGFYLLVRILSKEDFGNWVLYVTLSMIFEMAKAGFLQNGLIMHLVRAEDSEYAQILSSSWFLNALVGVISILLLVILANPLASMWSLPSFPQLVFIMALLQLPMILFIQSNIVLQAHMDFASILRISLFRQGSFFIVIVGLWLTKTQITIQNLAWLQFALTCLASLYAYNLTKTHWRPLVKLNKLWTLKLFHYGKFVLGTNLASTLNSSLDKFILGALLSPVQVATSNVAARLLNFIEVPINSIATVVFPKSAEKAANEGPESLKKLFEESVGIMLSMTIPFFIILFIFAPWVVHIVAGDQYSDAAQFLRIILVLALLKPFDRQSGVFLDALGKPQINLMSVLFSLSTTIVLSWVLISKYGLMGAAWALSISVFLTVLLKQILLRRYLKTSFFNSIMSALTAYPKAWALFRAKFR